jgi:hypothetical protein
MKQFKKKEDMTVIGDEWYGSDSPPDYVCDWCQCSLVRLSSGNNTESWFCRRCQIDYPDITETRKKSKLGTQREEIEPAVASIQTDITKEVEIRHTPEIRGGFAELQKKGLRIKDYHTTEKE